VIGKTTAPLLVEVPVKMGDQIFTDLSIDLQTQTPGKMLLVADENTYAACGEQVEAAMETAHLPIKKVIFPGNTWVVANETSITHGMHALDRQEYLLAAGGSGSITDIVRYTAYQARLPFLSIPTAASVDAYTSFTAAITLGQIKYSILTKAARTVYVHVPTLCSAPPRMTASGFSDMLAKYTALADWKLANLLVGDSYNDVVAGYALQAAQSCTRMVREIHEAAPDGMTALIQGLLISGRCMVTAKSSRPAAGSEHSLSHFWEINHQLRQMPESLHGEKAGVASVIIAELYERLRRLTQAEAAQRLERFQLPEVETEAARLRSVLGPAAGQIIANRPSFLGEMRAKVETIKANLIAHWGQIQAIAATVPTAAAMTDLLKTAGSLYTPDQIHVDDVEMAQAVQNAMYVRDRLTILELNRMLGLAA